MRAVKSITLAKNVGVAAEIPCISQAMETDIMLPLAVVS